MICFKELYAQFNVLHALHMNLHGLFKELYPQYDELHAQHWERVESFGSSWYFARLPCVVTWLS